MKTAADHLAASQLKLDVDFFVTSTSRLDDIAGAPGRLIENDGLDFHAPDDEFAHEFPSAIGRKSFPGLRVQNIRRVPMRGARR